MTASGLATHTYAKKGKYTVTITGRLPQLGWGIEDEEHKVACPEEDTQRAFPGIEKLVEIKSFGALDTNSLSGAFAGPYMSQWLSLEEKEVIVVPTDTRSERR